MLFGLIRKRPAPKSQAPLPRIDSVSTLNECLAIVSAVGLRSISSAPPRHLGIQLFVRHHDVGQPHLQGLGRRVASARYHISRRLFLADDVGQVRGAETGINRTDLRADLPKDRPLRGDRQVADRGQHIAAADGIALHVRDYGLGHVANQALHLLDRQAHRAVPAISGGLTRLIAAAAKSLVAGAREHDHADVPTAAGADEGRDQLLARLCERRYGPGAD